jgi:hypothetical protein
MGMLAPAFLAGIAALAVPIVLHLINRERKSVVEFPSLMFLQKVTYKSVRQQRIRHLALLLLRCAALLLLIAAFARPFFERRNVPGTANGARETVILLDRSWSMGYGERWAEAQKAAIAHVQRLGGNDRATLVLFDLEATAATEPSGAKDRLERAIRAATVGDLGTRYGSALKLASQILEGSNLPKREVVLISDFQAIGRPRLDEVHFPAGTRSTMIDVGAAESPDVAVAQVTTDREKSGGGDRLTVAARLTNTGARERGTEASFELAGRIIETKRLTVPAKGAVQVRFAATAIPSGPTRGIVRIGNDALKADDASFFTVSSDANISVLVVEPTRARANQSLFVARALEIGDRPTFSVTVRAESDLTAADLTDRSLVILNEVTAPSGALGARLRASVQGGTGLVLVPGETRSENWAADWRDLLPVRFGTAVDRSTSGGGTLASIDYSHPMFEAFAGPRGGDFSTVHLYRYRAMSALPQGAVIARHDDGSPALVERALGAGKILAWSGTLDDFWGDLPTQPVFLPFVHELAKYSARYSDARGWFPAGSALDLSRHGELTAMFQRSATSGTGDPELLLVSPTGKRERLRATGVPHVGILREAGFYELRTVETPAGSGRPIAVNVDLADGDLGRMDPKEITALIEAPAPEGIGSTAPPDAAAAERRQTLWWYLMVLALAVLVGETVLSNRLSRSAA